MKKICPMMARGWLANKFAYSSKGNEMQDVFFKVCECVERKCACWDDRKDACGLTRKEV